MKRAIVVATLLLQISAFATAASAQSPATAQSAESKQCGFWYLGVLRYVMPLALVLDIIPNKECQYQYEGVPGTATLEKALDLTPHKPQ